LYGDSAATAENPKASIFPLTKENQTAKARKRQEETGMNRVAGQPAYDIHIGGYLSPYDYSPCDSLGYPIFEFSILPKHYNPNPPVFFIDAGIKGAEPAIKNRNKETAAAEITYNRLRREVEANHVPYEELNVIIYIISNEFANWGDCTKLDNSTPRVAYYQKFFPYNSIGPPFFECSLWPRQYNRRQYSRFFQ
jgi:hypothetical protein